MAYKPPRHVFFGPKDPITGEAMEEPVYEYVEFPRMLYHPELGEMVVNSQEEVDSLGDEWKTKPIGAPHAPSQEELRAARFAAVKPRKAA